MKVFFSASQRGRETLEDNYQHINQYLQDYGYINVNKDLIQSDHKKFLKDLKKADEKYYKKMTNSLMKQIRSVEVCVFECSFHSLSVGFMINYALQIAKPTIVLYENKYNPTFLRGLSNEKLIIRKYTQKGLRRTLKQALTIAKQRRDKRFNFYLSTKLLEYIETVGREEGSTKSKVMRDIILRDMRNRGCLNYFFEE